MSDEQQEERVGFNRLVICDGDCDKHEGEIKKVKVKDTKANLDWGVFNYCENAIEEDKRRGLLVLST